MKRLVSTFTSRDGVTLINLFQELIENEQKIVVVEEKEQLEEQKK